MRVIFLDIDGVLNTWDYIGSLYLLANKHKVGSSIDEYGQLFDPRCVNYLDYIIRETDAKIVISSTWRNKGISNLQEMWEMRDLPGEIIDVTPLTLDGEIVERYYHVDADRGYEIQEWLDNHDDIESYVILDDMSDMLPSQNFVKCDGKFGITREVANMAIHHLIKEKYEDNIS